MKFLAGLDEDSARSLKRQLRDIWTYSSVSLEGNSLTLAEVEFVLDGGLVDSAMPQKDRLEVIGHGKSIERLYQLIGKTIGEQDIFDLHRLIQTESVTDIYKPIGAWKNEPNGTYIMGENGKRRFMEYAHPIDVPVLMRELIEYINSLQMKALDFDCATSIYATIHMGIAHIHPFWDGNGRMARLLANLPVLSSGHPPIVIPVNSKTGYIQVLSKYQSQIGRLTRASGIWPDISLLTEFTGFCREEYRSIEGMVAEAHHCQRYGNRVSAKPTT